MPGGGSAPVSLDVPAGGVVSFATMRHERICRWAFAVSLVAVAMSGQAFAGSGAAAGSSRPRFLSRAVRNRLTVGLRLSRFWLVDSRRYGENGLDNHNASVNFLGSLWGLDPQQSFVPAPFLEYRVYSGFGAGVAYDQDRVKTLDWGNAEKTATAGDGDLRIRGLQAYAFGRVPSVGPVTPAVRGGYSWYSSAFFEAPGWPGQSFAVGDTRGFFLGVDASVAFWRHGAFEVSYEHQWLKDIGAKALFADGGRKKGSFPMGSDVLRVGVAFRL